MDGNRCATCRHKYRLKAFRHCALVPRPDPGCQDRSRWLGMVGCCAAKGCGNGPCLFVRSWLSLWFIQLKLRWLGCPLTAGCSAAWLSSCAMWSLPARPARPARHEPLVAVIAIYPAYDFRPPECCLGRLTRTLRSSARSRSRGRAHPCALAQGQPLPSLCPGRRHPLCCSYNFIIMLQQCVLCSALTCSTVKWA